MTALETLFSRSFWAGWYCYLGFLGLMGLVKVHPAGSMDDVVRVNDGRRE
jgi:hypothetical protein